MLGPLWWSLEMTRLSKVEEEEEEDNEDAEDRGRSSKSLLKSTASSTADKCISFNREQAKLFR